MSASSSRPADVTMPYVNGATGPIEVKGAKPGDMLTVEVLDMKVDGLGFSSLWPGIGIFPDWVRHKEFGIKTQVVEVKDGLVHWNDRLKLPVRPMIGVIGVAPVHGAVLTVDNGTHGGNLDVQEITTGNKIMLRVHHEGAHLFLGDCHAIQGDGECVGMGAVEIAAELQVRVSLSPAPRPHELAQDRDADPLLHRRLRPAAGGRDADRVRGADLLDGGRLGHPGRPTPTCCWPRSPRRAAPRWSIPNTATSARSRRRSWPPIASRGRSMTDSAVPPNELSALAAAQAIAAGTLSARALDRSCLARIAAREPDVGAWQFLDPTYALAQADACDELAGRDGRSGRCMACRSGSRTSSTRRTCRRRTAPCSAPGGDRRSTPRS